MESPDPATAGIMGSFRVLGDSLLASVEDRLKLFSLELQEEKFRLIQILFWISAVIFTAIMAVMFTSLTLVYFFWESARLAVLGGLALFYTAALVAIIIAFRRYLERQPRPFAATIEELGEDRSCITREN